MCEDTKLVRIANFKQACAYVKNGIKPIDLEYGERGRMVFIFKEEDTVEVWEKWKSHKLEI